MMTPKKIHKIFMPQKRLVFLKTPQNNEFFCFEPKKKNEMSLHIYKNIRVPPPPPPPWGSDSPLSITRTLITQSFWMHWVKISGCSSEFESKRMGQHLKFWYLLHQQAVIAYAQTSHSLCYSHTQRRCR